jgi:hypothetical protein
MKPVISNERIIDCLNTEYGIKVANLLSLVFALNRGHGILARKFYQLNLDSLKSY